LERYLDCRKTDAKGSQNDYFFVGANGRTLSARTASATLNHLFQKAGLKPARGRIGPRPYDLRHAFAVHRLARWYSQGVDLHARLPWLSAYMGHTDIVGTETYLNATPELLQVAGNRLRRRYRRPDQELRRT
jgi:site-specific recombinase XerD